MKTELTALASQREIKCCEKKIDRPLIFFLVLCCSYNILVCWFHPHCCTSGVKPLFRACLKMEQAPFSSLHLAISGLQLTVFTLSHLAAHSFLFSIPGHCLKGLFIWVPSTNRNLSIHYRYFSIFNLGVPDYFTVLLNLRTCVCECNVGVDCHLTTFGLYWFFFFNVYKSVLCLYSYPCICIYFLGFWFFIISLLPLNNLG